MLLQISQRMAFEPLLLMLEELTGWGLAKHTRPF